MRWSVRGEVSDRPGEREEVDSFVGKQGKLGSLALEGTWTTRASGGSVSLQLEGPRGGVRRSNAG